MARMKAPGLKCASERDAFWACVYERCVRLGQRVRNAWMEEVFRLLVENVRCVKESWVCVRGVQFRMKRFVAWKVCKVGCKRRGNINFKCDWCVRSR